MENETKMETYSSFPPVEDAWQALSKINYRKNALIVLNTLQLVVLISAAVSTALWSRARIWWSNSGQMHYQEMILNLEIWKEETFTPYIKRVTMMYGNE